ncbi:MAG TPA: nuclear transport factor 2 family protein, partial [Verrucomicrobiae bacterium]|nr:nuclear transport factor 2 family protein [Verrucomicrobiae bacterium]
MIRRVRMGLLALALAALPVAAVAAPSTDEAILKLEDQRIQAMLAGDVATLDRVLAPELTYGHSNGKMDTKASFLAQIRSGDLRYKALRRQDVRVQVIDSTAIVTGQAALDVRTAAGDVSIPIRFTDVWVRRGDHWEMVAWQ